MIGELPNYEYIGRIRADIFLTDNYVKDLGYGPCYAMTQDELLAQGFVGPPENY
jgi:hypothetical protein